MINIQNPLLKGKVLERFMASTAASAVLLSTVQEISIVNSGVYIR